MTNRAYDAIIIGTGQAGPPLAKRLSQAGMSVAIIERHLFGGTCVNTGCIPTKAMVASAYAAHLARRAGEFGVAIDGSISVNMPQVKARKDAISQRSRAAVEKGLRGLKNCVVHQGHARLGGLRWHEGISSYCEDARLALLTAKARRARSRRPVWGPAKA